MPLEFKHLPMSVNEIHQNLKNLIFLLTGYQTTLIDDTSTLQQGTVRTLMLNFI